MVMLEKDDPQSNQLAPAGSELLPFSQPVESVLQSLNSTPDGLTETEARDRLAQFGPNVLPRASKDGPLQVLFRQINSPLVWVLIAAGVLAIAMGKATDGMVVLAVVVLNTIIGFVQEYKASKAIEALVGMVPENATVSRNGKRITIPGSELVPGDVIHLASGDKVPADARLISVRNLQIEEAALTGESVPVEKQLNAVGDQAAIGDRTNMAFGGTLVTYGTGSAVITSTGARTELGRISKMLNEAANLQTPLTKALEQIGKLITVAILIVAAIMLVIGTGRAMAETGVPLGDALRETVIFAIALAVGAIPEGLPAIVTIALAIGVQRMAGRRAVIRKLPAVETLGSTTTICSDKTGTLTRNEMTVQALWTPVNGAVEVTGVGYAPEGEVRRDGQTIAPDESTKELVRVGALCNDATLQKTEGQWQLTGDPTEGALVVSAEKLGVRTDATRQAYLRIDAIPFESENQFMATLHRVNDAESEILVKGAPEVVLRRCPNTDAASALREVERLASEGMRILAFARKPVSGSVSRIELEDIQDLDFVGLQGMIDPPRPEAIEAIRACHAAGITVKMITGDHHGTARAIGRQLNLIQEQDAITGAQLADATDEQLRTLVNQTNVFARVAPEHKLRLVRALQDNGHVVAMTGDGVNDAPALKQANIGVAMGITGTSVSKESADIVLTDDNFASIAAAVEEGRRVYDNLVKSLAFVLPTNLGLAFILMGAVAFFPFAANPGTGVRELLLPMLPTQLLWINLVATVALALPLAFEAKEPNVMSRPPRDPKEPVLSRFVAIRTVLAASLMTAGAIGLFLWERQTSLSMGLSEAQAIMKAQTMAVTTVIMFQIFYMLNCRSLRDSIFRIGLFSNPTVYVGIVALLILQAAFIYAPPLQQVFQTTALGWQDLLLAAVVGAIILPVISFEKWLKSRKA